jgi:two-component system response regulator AtoC
VESGAGAILVVDDEADTCEVLRDRLEAMGYEVLTAEGGRECLAIIDRQNLQLVLLDVAMPGMNGLEVLTEIRRRGHDVPVVMVTAFGTIERAVEAMKKGSIDFIPKPFDLDHVALVVAKALDRQTLKRNIGVLEEQVDDRHRIVIGVSGQMSQVIDVSCKAAASKSTILLLGESGTGKEVFARAIHSWSERKNKPFVPINCVGLSKELLESELFGYEKGAFTGALNLKMGKLELAHGGTVFLDEIGDISAEMQTKLLRFLQEREFERVGGTKAIRVDVRIIAATNQDLDGAVKAGRFREDLFYRLNVIRLELPALRERRDDIPDLAKYFLRKFGDETKKRFTAINDAAMVALAAYGWPGNVRELANVIESAVVLGQGPELTVDHLPAKVVSGIGKFSPLPIASSSSPVPDGKDAVTSLPAAIEQFERQLIEKALRDCGGTKQRAAQRLGLSRQGLIKKLKRYGITT